jgi:anti-sigma B factor antagonist
MERAGETALRLTKPPERVKQLGKFYSLLIAKPSSGSLTTPSEVAVNISVRKVGQATIIDLEGALKLGEAEQAFREQVQQLLDSGTSHLAVNLAGVTELDSSGIGALVRAFTSLKRAGGKCTFYAPSKRVTQILKMVRLDSILDLVEDEATALARI